MNKLQSHNYASLSGAKGVHSTPLKNVGVTGTKTTFNESTIHKAAVSTVHCKF